GAQHARIRRTERADVDRYFFFRPPRRLLPAFFGTFAPERLASDSPMAIACSRLFTFLPERPDLRVPRFRSCMAFLTLDFAFLPYLAIPRSFSALPRVAGCVDRSAASLNRTSFVEKVARRMKSAPRASNRATALRIGLRGGGTVSGKRNRDHGR